MESLNKVLAKGTDTLDNTQIENLKKAIIKDYDKIMKYPKALKDRVMQKYSLLDKISISIYRYNILRKEGFLENAEGEIKEIIKLTGELGKVGTFAESDTVLKGRVEKTEGAKYVWVSNGGCAACDALDGQEFEEGEVPEAPHPNCQCTVEAVEGEGSEGD
ncbi:hypothetical protein tpqmel_0929, partial [Candidatus Gastranaerophilus sp. (ex Termes propinquus)]